ncbi:DUF6055 domain-containing protein [Thalassobellus suaedae]|uniref:DUF6055 domain-containing protein n=1 Tax=Thalassobellus suaedae TaxID=3074124 RepID=A0ABY9Y1D5_9FLAO|nr:DUF6055 domain-containing protein [Flavobacteriaceae bacterium HL-DH10]
MKRIPLFKIIITCFVLLCFSCSSSNGSDDPISESPETPETPETPDDTKITPPENFQYIFAEKPTTGKAVYIPNELKENDFDSNDSKWSYQRSASSDDIIVFWEKGFGQYPSKTSRTNLRVDINNLITMAEGFYTYYRDTMKFVTKGSSQTDNYRMIVMLLYQEEWLATGAGYDNVIGALWINPATTHGGAVIAHEFGHSFQYQVACDGKYGFRDQPYVGQFWEQCAQYMSWQQNNGDYVGELPYLLDNIHKNFSHEDIRYQSMYLQEYWKEKHGIDFLGKLWRNALKPEHPIQTYKRITEISQEVFNDEVFEYASKNITWDYPLGVYNKDYIKNLSIADQKNYQHVTVLETVGDGYYQISANQIPQPYGYNAIQLSVPVAGTSVSVDFDGLDGGYANVEGWRYGFVAVKEGDVPFYGTMERTKKGNASIIIPEGTKTLWLVVTGAPTEHVNHIWDDEPSNDQKFPYKVKFTNTALE